MMMSVYVVEYTDEMIAAHKYITTRNGPGLGLKHRPGDGMAFDGFHFI